MGSIYLIRHGQASFGAANYDQLSATGVEQARVLGESLRGRIPKIDAVICGQMQRHLQTAEHCLGGMGQPAAWDTHAGWNEFDHEALIAAHEPKYADRAQMAADLARSPNPRKTFQALFDAAIQRWVGGQHDQDYAESWPAFNARVNEALNTLIEQLGSSKTALVFSSGGPISALACRGFGAPDTEMPKLVSRLANAAVTKVVYGSRGTHLMTFNEHGHFEGPHDSLITYR
jgi:broad specificity phosphatase PhoE